jgi:Tol biopolymer transport system component
MRIALGLIAAFGLAACVGTDPVDDVVLRDRIVFVVDTGRYRLLHMRPDGSDLRAIPVELPGHAFYPDVSPDGRKIALTVGITSLSIYVVNTDGTGLMNLTPGLADNIAPDWSPDGRLIAYSSRTADGNSDVIVMGEDGSEAQGIPPTPAQELWPAWAPDGQSIAFASDRAEAGNEEIYVVSLADSTTIRLTDSEGDDNLPAWSPAGETLGFVSARNFATELFVMRGDGSMQRPLFAAQVLYNTAPDWSPTGGRIVYQCDPGGICVANADGTGAVTLAPGRDPTWAR